MPPPPHENGMTATEIQESLNRAPSRLDIQAAMNPEIPYFITTSLYWDCECPQRPFQRPASQESCPDCETFRDEQPDSRIGELPAEIAAAVNWTSPDTVNTLDQHNLVWRPAPNMAQA